MTIEISNKWQSFRDLEQIPFKEFITICEDATERNKLRNDIMSGDIIIVKNAIEVKVAEQILTEILSKDIKISKQTKILEGVSNIHYVSNNKKSKKGEYSAIDKSWYFFPWNRDELGVMKVFQKIFDNVVLLNNHDPKKIVRNTPSDGYVQRFHLINYPPGVGEISMHIDPTNVVQVNAGIYLSEFGKDYTDGGFYALDSLGNKKNFDREVSLGDMILFYPGMGHGVDPIKGTKKNKDKLKDGRYFFNMSIVQSHEMEDRHRAIGL